MQTQQIALKDLHVSPLNMRAEKKTPSLKRMAEIAANILPTMREKRHSARPHRPVQRGRL